MSEIATTTRKYKQTEQVHNKGIHRTMDMSLQLVILECLTIVFLIRMRTSTGEQQLCNNLKPETGSVVNLNMDTTQIIRQNGMCSCKLTVDNRARISMFSSISSPNCITNIELIDTPVAHIFSCRNGKIDSTTNLPYNNDHTTGDVFWLMVTSSVNTDHSLSGLIQIKSQSVQGGIADTTITVECYDPNTNSSSTTTTAATTTSSTVVTTKSVLSPDSPTTTIKQPSPTTTKGQTTLPDRPISVPPVTQDISTQPPVDVTTGQVIAETSQQKSTPILTQSSSSSPTSNSGITVTVLVGGVVAGVLVAVIIISGFFLLRRCRKRHHEEHRDEDIIPVSETHPTYCGLTGGDNRVYDHIDTPHQDKDYYNMAPISNYQNV